jgi:hypothetical protein
VGGESVPVDKIALLVPYMGLAFLIAAAITVTAVYARRDKRFENPKVAGILKIPIMRRR